MKTKKTVLVTALSAALGLAAVTSAEAAIVNASWSGLFTWLDPNGTALTNTGTPYYYDPTWGYGARTQISGTFQFDTSTGAGSATINPFQFNTESPGSFHDIVLQGIGDGMGGSGSLVAGKLLFDWAASTNINVGVILDAAGFFGAGPHATSQTISGVGALPASNGIRLGKYPIGPTPIATTAWDTDYHNNPGCVGTATCLIVNGDTIGGDPMDNGVFPNHSFNFDITSIHVDSVENNAVPIPGAAWLLGSGLLGLVNLSRCKKNR